MKRSVTGGVFISLAAVWSGLGPTSALAAPPVVTAKSTPVLEKKAMLVPPEVETRLKKAGLDPNAHNLGAQLKALAEKNGPAYIRSNTRSVKAVRLGGVSRRPPTVLGSSNRILKERFNISLNQVMAPAVAGIINTYADGGAALGADPTLAVFAPGNVQPGKWPGDYYYLVITRTPLGIQSTDSTQQLVTGTATLSFGCEPPKTDLAFGGTVTDRPVYIAPGDSPWPVNYHGLKSYPSGNGFFYYYIELWLEALPVAHARAGSVSFSFSNLTIPASSIQVLPDQISVTIDATVDQSPALASLGTVDPWGPSGIVGAHGLLASPTVARVGDGVYSANQAQGDDILGVGIQLAAGWKVTSTTIKSATSATAPDELAPDNAWRGATVKQGPQGSDLRTLVHWHYSGIDSLAYTIEWSLTGPSGQRPLMSMAMAGSCGN